MARRRSPRRHPQINTSEDGAGMACRRSPRLHPQIHTSEDGAGMACRRSPRLHPQIDAVEDGAGITRRRRRRGPSPASLPDNEDMLWEILLRLPPQPSSLPRASAVCKRWRGLVTDPRFLRRFRAHHRKPRLLGVFQPSILCAQRRRRRTTLNRRIKLRSILETPDRIPPHAIQTSVRSATQLLGCRHGRVLLMGEGRRARRKVTVCDPVTGEVNRVRTPPNFKRYKYLNVAVLCAVADQGHVHGSCHSSPYKLVLMSPCGEDDQPVACVYSSETGVWGSRISTTARCGLGAANPGILVGNVLYWSSKSSDAASLMDLDVLTDDIVEFDLDRQSLAVIKGPPDLNASIVHQIIQTEEGAVGLAVFSQGSFKMWERKVNRHGGATWLLRKTVEMRTILGHSLSARLERQVTILGYDEENGVIFLRVDANVYMVQLMSMQSRKLYKSRYANSCYPFTSFYAPAGGCDGAEVLRPV